MVNTDKSPKVDVGVGAIERLAGFLTEQKIKNVFVYADKNTFSAAGERVSDLLKDQGIKIKQYIFDDDRVEPNEASVGLAVMNFDPCVDAVIAVGSGVINDISKIVANASGKTYIVVATAPSMDGYASATSSIPLITNKFSLI